MEEFMLLLEIYQMKKRNKMKYTLNGWRGNKWVVKNCKLSVEGVVGCHGGVTAEWKKEEGVVFQKKKLDSRGVLENGKDLDECLELD